MRGRPERRPWAAWLAAGVLAVLAGGAVLAPWLEAVLGVDAQGVDLFRRLSEPDDTNLLGTDELGRDLAVRLLLAGRVSLVVGLAGAAGATLIGTAVGLVAGLAGGRIDAALMRFTDAVIALPLLPLLIVLAALDPAKLGLEGQGAWTGVARIAVVIALFMWTTTARLVRSEVRSLRQREFVLAARALGAGAVTVALRHLLPNVAAIALVAGALAVGHAILTESVLSFLGLGVQPPLPSWGNMLSGAQDLLFEAPRLALLPGLMIFATVIAVNVLGNHLRDRLDPRSSRR
ncbi:MAG: ABC transporter permease [Geminicoccaceae bacterium]